MARNASICDGTTFAIEICEPLGQRFLIRSQMRVFWATVDFARPATVFRYRSASPANVNLRSEGSIRDWSPKFRQLALCDLPVRGPQGFSDFLAVYLEPRIIGSGGLVPIQTFNPADFLEWSWVIFIRSHVFSS